MTQGWRRALAVLTIAVWTSSLIGPPLAAWAQQTLGPDYRVGPGDRIFLSVPQRQDLSRELVVKEDGSVTLPLIGEVVVTGLTAREIEAKLLQALRDYYPSVNRVQITITEAVSQIIYVTGQVRNPGKYTFAKTVNVWELLREAGGPSENASLDNVRIVKDRSRGGTTKIVNVLAAIEGGSVDNLPDLEAGDTVIVPTVEEVYTGTFGVNVFGAVVRPGVYRLQARQDLASAVLLAGGPIQLAELKRVALIRPRGDGTYMTIRVNMANFLDHGDPFGNPKLQPGDTVHIPRKSALVQLATSDVGTLLSMITAIATTTLLVIAIRDQVNTNK
jgi:polysaccharide export outer membrane protein